METIAMIILAVILIFIFWGVLSSLGEAGERELNTLINSRKADHAETYARIDKELTAEKVKAAKSGKSKLESLDI